MRTMTISPSYTPTAARPARSSVRLTRRGRLVVFLAGLFLVLLVGIVWGSSSVAGERPGTPEPTSVVTVMPGDTLFDIAAGVTTDGDVAAMVERIQRLNALNSGMLTVGQKIRVPAE